MTPLEKRLRYLLSTLSVLALVALIAVAWGWWQMRGSLPQLDGVRALTGLSAPVTAERDALGVPTLKGATRNDVARATGFVHAQDRFFQMDLLRRTGAGELSELIGPATLSIDRAHRLHGFRRTAEKALAAMPAEQRALIDAYTAGVNAGLTALAKTPWEYLALRTTPRAWQPQDSLLVIYAMWFDLQDATASYEQSIRALRLGAGQAGLDFFAPRGDSWDAALDGSTFPQAPLPPIRLKPIAQETVDLKSPAQNGTPADKLAQSDVPDGVLHPGSNAFAVTGIHTATGAAMLANDMHLSLNVPRIWYRIALQWPDVSGQLQHVTGLTLPGMPVVIVGSNQHVAWGFTNSYVDTLDVVLVETDATAQILYRTPHGWTEIEDRSEPIKVRGEATVPFTTRWTEWGPIIGGPEEGRYRVLRWNAHDAESTNGNLLEMENATTVDDAVTIAHRAGMPNENLVAADSNGSIAWTITGTLPQRVGYDGRQPVAWTFGDRKWDGWLQPEAIPELKFSRANPSTEFSAATPATTEGANLNQGMIWTANQRLVGGETLKAIGDNGYAGGARGSQIRDDLHRLFNTGKKVMPADLLAIQLDDRALYLERWQKVLLAVLSDEAVESNRGRAEMRDVVRQWDGHAGIDSAAYRLVGSFHRKLAARGLEPFFAKARESYAEFDYGLFHYDDALWRLVQEKPARLLNPEYRSWEELMLAAADEVITEVEQAGLPFKRFTWGAHNTLRMRHPFSRFVPRFIGQFLDLPAQQLPGDNDMPRVQGPAFGASERMIVSPGREKEGILHLPGGQSGNPLSPYYRAGHSAWVRGEPTPFLPGPTQHTLTLQP